MIGRRTKKIVFITACILIVSVFTFCFSSCSFENIDNSKEKLNTVWQPEHKEAIILIPGFLASYLLDEKTGTQLWDPLYIKNEEDNNRNIDPVTERFMKIKMNADGTPTVAVSVPTMDDEAFLSGVTEAYKNTLYELNRNYSEDYDIVMWQYDWRIDNRITGKQLEDFIKLGGWEKVILLPHSMGGIAASAYLARSQENRDKVKYYASFGTPYLGVVDIVGLMEGLGFPFVNSMVTAMLGNTLKNIAVNVPGLFQMLPGERLLNSWYYKKGENGELLESFLYRQQQDGTYSPLNWEQIKDFYKKSVWARYAESDSEFGTPGELKTMYTEGQKFSDSLWVDDGTGNYVHITQTLNGRYHYFGGIDYNEATNNTSKAIIINNDGTFSKQIVPRPKNKTGSLADGTALLVSAIMGLDVSDETVSVYKYFTHTGLMSNIGEDRKDTDGTKLMPTDEYPLAELYEIISALEKPSDFVEKE